MPSCQRSTEQRRHASAWSACLTPTSTDGSRAEEANTLLCGVSLCRQSIAPTRTTDTHAPHGNHQEHQHDQHLLARHQDHQEPRECLLLEGSSGKRDPEREVLQAIHHLQEELCRHRHRSQEAIHDLQPGKAKRKTWWSRLQSKVRFCPSIPCSFNSVLEFKHRKISGFNRRLKMNWPFPPPTGPVPWTPAQEQAYQRKRLSEAPESPL